MFWMFFFWTQGRGNRIEPQRRRRQRQQQPRLTRRTADACSTGWCTTETCTVCRRRLSSRATWGHPPRRRNVRRRRSPTRRRPSAAPAAAVLAVENRRGSGSRRSRWRASARCCRHPATSSAWRGSSGRCPPVSIYTKMRTCYRQRSAGRCQSGLS